MHGIPAELLDSAIKAFVGAVTTWAASAVFKKLNFKVRLFFARGLRLFKKNLPLSPFAFCCLICPKTVLRSCGSTGSAVS